MPSLSYTPGQLALAGGEFNPEPVRFSFTPGRLNMTGGTLTIGPSLSSNIGEQIAAVLDNLFASESIVNEKGQPTRRFQEIWGNAIGGIKEILTFQGAAITDLQAIYAGINAAQATATQAVQQQQATDTTLDLANSYTDPVNIVTAASDGTVTIAAHDRVYPVSGTRVSVNGGSVSGQSGDVTIFYTDPAREGGSVTYQGTNSAVAQTGNTHIVGQVPVPAVGEPPAQGAGPTAPGYQIPTNWDVDVGYVSTA